MDVKSTATGVPDGPLEPAAGVYEVKILCGITFFMSILIVLTHIVNIEARAFPDWTIEGKPQCASLRG